MRDRRKPGWRVQERVIPPLAAGAVGAPSNRARMSMKGHSLSMFVVQRTFRHVRRGYDPVEVDRHLELVSRWFTSTDIGVALTHERTTLQRREAAVAQREADLDRSGRETKVEADATLEAARGRGAAGAARGDELLVDARGQAEQIAADAEREREKVLA